jgi:hypothetical protein
MLTAERLRELLNYDPDAGVFMWRVRGRGRPINRPAGTADSMGYMRVQIDRRFYRAHRLAWLYMTGAWPANHIDHINGMVGDNRIDNLREVTQAENMWSRKLSVTNSSGFKGVSKKGNKWRAKITKDGRDYRLGYYNTAAEAHDAYIEAATVMFGEFARAE